MKKIIILLATGLIFNSVAVSGQVLYGDADNNGVLDSADSAIILQKVLNNSYQLGCDFEVADVDGDNALTAGDSALVLQKVMNKSYMLPVEVGCIIDASKLDYGEYVQDIVVGDITISASAVAPVYVQDVEVPMEWLTETDPKVHNVKVIKLGKENSIIVNIGDKSGSQFTVEYLNYQGMPSDLVPKENMNCSDGTGRSADVIHSGDIFGMYLYSCPSYEYIDLKADRSYEFGKDGEFYLCKAVLK